MSSIFAAIIQVALYVFVISFIGSVAKYLVKVHHGTNMVYSADDKKPKRHVLEQNVFSGDGGMSGKVPDLTNRASVISHRIGRELQYEDAHHDSDDTKFSASVPASGYEFGGRQVVDDFAELHKRNEEHEKHLQSRIRGGGGLSS